MDDIVISIEEFTKKQAELGACPEGQRFCLFLKYVPNPLASAWKWYAEKEDAERAKRKYEDEFERNENERKRQSELA